MLAVQQLALRHASEDADTPAPLTQVNVRVEHIAPGTTVGDLQALHEDHVHVSRLRHEEQGPVEVAFEAHELRVDDVITLVGPDDVVQQIVRELGHESSHHLAHDRASLDFQRAVIGMGGTMLAGLLAGAQTQPALLSYANEQTNHDFRVPTGYTTAYPAAMLTKILAASVLALLA